MKVAIIGAGAAGIFAAININKLNKKIKVDLFESNNDIGKKILASGNGKCNISNIKISKDDYACKEKGFLDYVLKNFTFEDLEKKCLELGLLLETNEEGKAYPLSNEAKTFVNLLKINLLKGENNVFFNSFVENITKEDGKFIVETNKKKFKNYDKILITTGLGAAPQLGSNEEGLKIAKKFGHLISETYPSLVGLCTKSNYLNRLQGTKKKCKISLFSNKIKIQEKEGDLLFTKYGISGFSVLDVSQKASFCLLSNEEVYVLIDFFPQYNVNELANILSKLLKNKNNIKFLNILDAFISAKIGSVILDKHKIDKNILAEMVTNKDIKKIAYSLNSWREDIVGTNGFKHAEVSGGGVLAKEINSRTYESLKCKGLFFSGEVIDVVGRRGGYNLHFAFASGIMASRGIVSE